MSVLCAIDFSRPSALALAAASRIAATFHQPLAILTVADPLLAAAERMQSGGDEPVLLARELAAFVDETLAPGASSRHRLLVRVGDAAAEILAQADLDGAQLVVLATRGASGVAKVVFGSVAERVLRTTTRPVLVVPPGVEGGPLRTLGAMEEVLAPIDFHDHAFDDARLADRVARASHARLRLLHVVAGRDDMRWAVLPPTMASQLEEELGGLRSSVTDAAHQALERLAESLGGTPGPTLEVVEGPVAERIAQVADRAEVDLVVLALRGVPGLLGTRVGAVAYRVLCASPVPVLAVPHEARAEGTLAFLEGPPTPLGFGAPGPTARG
jgi:nucleotide-binding universal stress UspA family protein